MLARTPSWPPDYNEIFKSRQEWTKAMRERPEYIIGAKEYYRTRPVEFINHWCDTYDPRRLSNDNLARIPFHLFKRQIELVEFLHACLVGETNGLVEKCRDLGATWVCCAFAVWLWLFWPGAAIGFGSRKEMLVDRIGDPDSIFEKMRMLIRGLPPEFLPSGFNEDDHLTYMRIINPETGASITGESGDNIGRGGRKLVYIKDESAHYEHPELIEASLNDNTRVQIDVSSVCGLGTVFHRKREAGIDWTPGAAVAKDRTNVFVMAWNDHPDKTKDWYDARRKKAVDEGLLHIFAQEVDRSYSASMEGIIIQSEWVDAAIDAHIKLGFGEYGLWSAALDVADEGLDTNALSLRRGIVLKDVQEWGDRDTGATTRKAVAACEDHGEIECQYDCVGIGAGIKAEANRLKQEKLMPVAVTLVPWNAGGEVIDKDKHVIPGDKKSPLNGDLFGNLKAQAWWMVARRFEKTYRAIRSIAPDATPEEKTFTWKPDELISISSKITLLRKLQKELCQVTAQKGSRMKLIVDKAPDGAKSPNCGDSVIMNYWPVPYKKPLIISDELLAATARR